MFKEKRGVKRQIPEEELNSESDYDEDEEEEIDEDEETSDEESDEEEDDEDNDDDNTDDELSQEDINQIDDNINLKDISDDEMSFEEMEKDEEEDDGHLFTKVLENNDRTVNSGLVEEQPSGVLNIANNLESVETSNNVARVDEYDYDSSDEEDVLNTIGNIPYEWYKDYVHIGYDVHGRKIVKPPNEEEVEEFLRQMDDPSYWRTVKDHLTGQKVVLSDHDLDLVKRIRNAKCPDPNYNMHEPFISFFSYEKMIHPVTNRPEPKASFIPSLSEKRIVSKLVAAIKKARLKPKPQVKRDSQFNFSYDLWEKEGEKNKRLNRYIPAPKPAPPGHEESYNPPPEYLLTEEEEKEWREQEPEDRKSNYVPRKYPTLRQVPAYPEFVKERFERCLDLYLCPRVRRNRVQVNAEDLLPQLPKPSDLQPFPSVQSVIYTGHQDKVLSITVEPAGQFMASGDQSGVLKFWEVLTGRCFKTLQLESAITCVEWYPNQIRSVIAVVVGHEVVIINTGLGDKQVLASTDEFLSDFVPQEKTTEDEENEKPVVEWNTLDRDANAKQWVQGERIRIKHQFEIAEITWHAGGDYFATLMPRAANRAVVIHNLTKHKSQVPFKRSKDIIQSVKFHPSRAYFFVATKKSIRVYDLIKQQQTKKLMANCNDISSIAIHPGGDNLIVGSIDPRVQWFDLDLSSKAYKTLRYHSKAVRSVAYHSRYPLFASSSDDGSVVVCHGMVYDDLNQNALIVPVKVLKAVRENAPMLKCTFHPSRPWLFASSANTIRLFS